MDYNAAVQRKRSEAAMPIPNPTPSNRLAGGFLTVFLAIPGILAPLGLMYFDREPPKQDPHSLVWVQRGSDPAEQYVLALSVVLGLFSVVMTPAAIIVGVLSLRAGGGSKARRGLIVATLVAAGLCTFIFAVQVAFVLTHSSVP